FRELYAKYPRGRFAERAAWRVGWRAYRQGRYQETIQYFERAARDFPRSDYRPSWLYWSARSHAQRNNNAAAEERYRLVAADYLNSYYGRLAVKRLGHTPVVRTTPAATADITLLAAPPPNAVLIRALLEAEL